MNKSMIAAAFVIILLLGNCNVATAGDTGQVNITIAATPPVITSISVIQKQEEGITLKCNAEVWGNNPEDYTLNYRWYVNGELRSEAEGIGGLEVGDNVICEAEVKDSFGNIDKAVNVTEIAPYYAIITGKVISDIRENKATIPFSLLVFFALIIAVKIALNKKIRGDI